MKTLPTGTKDLAVRDETALADPLEMTFTLNEYEVVEGTDNLSGEDFQFPKLTLVQPTHRNSDIPGADAHRGEWYNDVTGEFSEDVHSIVLTVVKGRAAFDRDFSHESEPLCASDNALMPRSEYIGKVIQDKKTGLKHTINEEGCPLCPFARFTDTEDKSIPPMCAKAFTYSMMDASTGIPFVMRAQRTGTAAAKRLNTLADTLGRRRMIRIWSQHVESDSGSYYVPVFSTNGETSNEMKQYAHKLSKRFGNLAARNSQSVPSTSNGRADTDFSDNPAEEEAPF